MRKRVRLQLHLAGCSPICEAASQTRLDPKPIKSMRKAIQLKSKCDGLALAPDLLASRTRNVVSPHIAPTLLTRNRWLGSST
eukprot:11922944-Heterocapsa_arctica.AAC.1